MPERNADTFSMVTSGSARFPSVSAFRTISPGGVGPVDSTRAVIPGTGGAAATLDQAKADFEAAWLVFLAKRTEVDFQEWRDQQEWTERKYDMRKRGERSPTQNPSSLMTCPCGQIFDSHLLEETVIHVPHITASASTVH